MRETYHERIGAHLYRRVTTLAIIFMSVLSLGAISPVFAEEAQPPAVDDTAPIVTLNVQSGAVRNTVRAVLTVDDMQPKTAFIEVLHSDGRPFEPRILTESDIAASSIMLRWKTNDMPDGQYMIRYGATDAAGNATPKSEIFVTVDNKTPFTTLSETADYRTIGGSISHQDAILKISIDDVVTAMTPVIADTPDDDGNYIWTAVIPKEITDGDHAIAIMSSRTVLQPEGDPLVYESVVATQTVSLKTPPPPTPVTPPVPVDVPTLGFMEQIGQFVAPELPIAPIKPVTRLYGVAMNDLTSDATETATSPVVTPVTSSSVTRVSPETIVDDTAPAVAVSESGWIFFGIAWYWWLIVGGVVTAILLAVRMRFYQDDKTSNFIRAESV